LLTEENEVEVYNWDDWNRAGCPAHSLHDLPDQPFSRDKDLSESTSKSGVKRRLELKTLTVNSEKLPHGLRDNPTLN
jgi:hypothetical protein